MSPETAGGTMGAGVGTGGAGGAGVGAATGGVGAGCGALGFTPRMAQAASSTQSARDTSREDVGRRSTIRSLVGVESGLNAAGGRRDIDLAGPFPYIRALLQNPGRHRPRARDRSMKVRSSLKSLKTRHRDCKLVRRKGRVYIINKTNPRFKAKQG